MASKSRLTSSGYATKRKGSFAGKAVDLGIVIDIFTATATGRSAKVVGIQKPGIPSDAQPWLKNTLEILMGRRGNGIIVPEIPEITFSATPTQAQCEALYASLKRTRDALNELKGRFDS
ncbi:MAG TPA: hypothetical protein VFS89_06665 [Nitrosospira sp.]|nr:hypothetical protein [Nitrosospira sp.]